MSVLVLELAVLELVAVVAVVAVPLSACAGAKVPSDMAVFNWLSVIEPVLLVSILLNRLSA